MTLEPSTCVTLQADVPPLGFVEVTTLPAAPTATQKVLVGQDTLAKHGDHPVTAAAQSDPRTWDTVQPIPVTSGDAVATGDGWGVATIGVGGAVGDAIAMLVGGAVGDTIAMLVGVASAVIEARA